jgi:hypothetical protein
MRDETTAQVDQCGFGAYGGTMTSNSRSWIERAGKRLAIAALTTSLVVVVVGWMTGLRQMMHATLLGLAVVAFLPFVLIAGGVLIGLAVALLGALIADGDVMGDGVSEALVDGGGELISPYYRFLARQRHPVFWGVFGGVLLGGLLLWAIIAALIVPGEDRTVQTLAEGKAHIERVYEETGKFPVPSESRLATPESGPGGLQDGFARALRYEVSGKWKLASWKLTSHGFDGEPGADDLCVSGSTKIMKWAEFGVAHVKLFQSIASGGAAPDERLSGIQALQCAD